MAALRLPALTLDQAGPAAERPTYVSPDTTQGAQGDQAIANAYGQIGAKIEDATQQLTKVAIEAKHSADATLVLGARRDAQNLMNGLILDPTPDKGGFASLQGEDAMAKRDEYQRKYERGLDDIVRQLPTQEARQHATMHLLTFREQGFKHLVHLEATQVNAAAAATYVGAQQETLKTIAGLAPTDPDGAENALNSMRDQAALRAVALYGRTANKDQIASVVGPQMQLGAKAMIGGAITSNDPAAARLAYTKAGHLLSPDQARFFSASIDKMEADQKISQGAAAILGGATDADTGRIDPQKIVDAAAKLSEDQFKTPILQAVEQRQGLAEKAFHSKLAETQSRLLSRGMDPLGRFSLSNLQPADAADIVFLQQNGPKEWMSLRQVDYRNQSQDDRLKQAEQRAISSSNKGAFFADLADEGQKDYFGTATEAQVRAVLLSDQRYPGGMTATDLSASLSQWKRFRAAIDKEGKLAEPVAKIVTEALGAARVLNKGDQNKLRGFLTDDANAYIDDWKQEHGGKAPDAADVRKRVYTGLVQGRVDDTGRVYDDRARRVEFDRNQVYAGRAFVPFESSALPGADLAAAAAPRYVPRGPTVAFPRLGTPEAMRAPAAATISPTQAEQAKQWLETHGADPLAEDVRQRLKDGGY